MVGRVSTGTRLILRLLQARFKFCDGRHGFSMSFFTDKKFMAIVTGAWHSGTTSHIPSVAMTGSKAIPGLSPQVRQIIVAVIVARARL